MGQINLKVYQRSNLGSVKNITTKETYSTIGSDLIVARIAQTAGMKENEIKSALLGIKEAVRYFVLNGHTVNFGDFGYLKLSASCGSVAQAKQVSSDLVKSLSLTFSPSKKVKTALSNITFS